MMNSSKPLILLLVGLLLVYLIIKWIYRLILGLLDYGLVVILIICGIWYVSLPISKRIEINNKVKSFFGL